ncbi:MAG: GNAT family N-acetyltransferase [Solirubrobacteraceae bacterium]|nr:GNAT family N-acetyltransferase [Patulibacter sp.]
MAAPELEIVPLTVAAHTTIAADVHRYWVGGRTPPMHVLFVHEFGDLSVVALAGDQIAGFLYGLRSTTEPAGYVHLVGVHEEYRRRGIARRLYAAFAERAAATGASQLKAIVRPDNAPSIAFHTALGMTATAIDDYTGPGETRLVFRGPIDDVR